MKLKHRITALLLVLIMGCSIFATTVFAYSEDSDPEDESSTQETTLPSEDDLGIPPVQIQPTEPAVTEEGRGLSEDGNLVTRDLLYDKNTNKQFITVTTRSGETFYIIIDYDKPVDEAGNQYETYFLNLVDDTDLQALLEEAGMVITCDCPKKCVAGDVNTACAICSKNLTECVGVEKVPETAPVEPTQPVEPAEPSAKQESPMGILFIVLIVAVGGGLAYLYLKKKSEPKTKGKTDLDEYDYGVEDDEYADFEPYQEEEETE